MQKNESEQLPQEQREWEFELAKLDYARLGTQEQSIMDGRLQIWLIFFTIVGVPTGYVSFVGSQGSPLLLMLIPFFTTCLSLHIKHSEMVLRYDVRKQLKAIAQAWGYQNHESQFSKEKQKERRRWWHGWYRWSMAGAFLLVEITISTFITWYTFTHSMTVLGIGVIVLDILLIGITSLCLL